jgi:type IV secretory pathway ATPase VirB11/archaellum biosynthesis ATPase
VSAVALADLLRAMLRDRRESIVAGENRGLEASIAAGVEDPGHLGSMTTISRQLA